MWLLMTYTISLHDVHKIPLCECKMSFNIGSLGCVKYIEKKPTQYQPLPSFCGDNDQSQILKWNQKKNECLGELKESIPQIFARGLNVFSCQKRLLEDSISNQPVNAKLCETLVLLNHSNNITKN